jgi:hypothetical protein
MTMAPLVVKGKVLVGNSGGEFGVRGWLTALDAARRQDRLARLQHRARQGRADRPATSSRSTRGPRQGPRRHDVAARRVEDRRRHGVGLDLVRPRARTSSTTAPANPGPWNPEQRPGDNKWTSASSRAMPDTGEARWFYQWSPHDLFDYDGVNENVLLDLPIDGAARKVLVRPSATATST